MKLAVLPGDDIGPEIMDATLMVLRRADSRFGLDISLDIHPVGMAVYKERGTTLPADALEAARDRKSVV